MDSAVAKEHMPPQALYHAGDLKTCNQAMQELATLIGELSRQCEAGAPCQEQIASAKQVMDDFARWKRVNFPHEP
jgi:bacterioferritin-associated ferredoxin